MAKAKRFIVLQESWSQSGTVHKASDCQGWPEASRQVLAILALSKASESIGSVMELQLMPLGHLASALIRPRNCQTAGLVTADWLCLTSL